MHNDIISNSVRPAGVPTFESTRHDAQVVLKCADEWDGLTAAEALADLTAAENMIAVAKLKLVHRVETSCIWQNDANATPTSWLRDSFQLDDRQAKGVLRAAHAVDQLPTLSAAVADGTLTREAVDVIVAVGLANPERARAFVEFEHIFTELASKVPVSVLRRALRQWADQIDPLATAADEHDAHSRRFLHVNQLADGWHIEAFLPPEQGAKFVAALNAALQRCRRRERASESGSRARTDGQAIVDLRDGPSVAAGAVNDADPWAPVSRSTGQQRADAFIDDLVASAVTSGGLPETGGSRPVVSVTVPLQRLTQPCDHAANTDDLLTGIASTSDTTEPFGSVATLSVVNGPGEAIVSAQAAQRITCDCEVHRIVLNPDSLPLDVGRTTRTIPAHIRKALNARDKGCIYPHCDRPAGWCEGHHIVHWAHGGPTALKNLALLCSRHHHDAHAYGDQITIDTNGKPKVKLGARRTAGKIPKRQARAS